MNRIEKLKELRNKSVINIAYIQDSIKFKCYSLIDALCTHKRFNIIKLKSYSDIIKYYDNIDLYIPIEQYDYQICPDKIFRQKLYNDMKLIFIRYSLGWHKNISFQDSYNKCLMAFVDGTDLCFKKHFIYTGHPYSEFLKKPINCFRNVWKTNNKHILICPHWTINSWGSGKKHTKTNLIRDYNEILYIIDRYKNDCEFILRPHPNLFAYWKGNVKNLICLKTEEDFIKGEKVKDILNKINDRIEVICENNQVDLFKYSDAMIHDCGSFRCEYLYMNKPVCYMCNEINMNKSDWSNMGSDAIDCHELSWKTGDIEKFIQNVINGYDIKKENRNLYYSNYIEKYPNNKKPSENIINAILGKDEYQNLNIL